MSRKLSRHLVAASRYASQKNVFKFLRVKKFLKRFLVKTYVTTSEYVEATVPEPGCYIVHIIGVGSTSGSKVETFRISLYDVLRSMVSDLYDEYVMFYTDRERRENQYIKQHLLPIFKQCLMDMIEKRKIPLRLVYEETNSLVTRYYREIYECMAREVRRIDGCEPVEAGVLLLFKCRSETKVKTRSVRHAVRLVKATVKRVRGHEYYVVKLRVPKRVREKSSKMYVHIIKAVCV